MDKGGVMKALEDIWPIIIDDECTNRCFYLVYKNNQNCFTV